MGVSKVSSFKIGSEEEEEIKKKILHDFPRFLTFQPTFREWLDFRFLTDYKTFVEGYDLYRLNYVESAEPTMVKSILGLAYYGVFVRIRYMKKKGKQIVFHECLIDVDKLNHSVCDCNAFLYRSGKLCKHLVCALLYSVFHGWVTLNHVRMFRCPRSWLENSPETPKLEYIIGKEKET